MPRLNASHCISDRPIARFARDNKLDEPFRFIGSGFGIRGPLQQWTSSLLCRMAASGVLSPSDRQKKRRPPEGDRLDQLSVLLVGLELRRAHFFQQEIAEDVDPLCGAKLLRVHEERLE